jgi:DNA-directed RNA polymerase specialized sigma24 family protein
LYSKIKSTAKALWSREFKQFFDFEDISQEMLLKLWDLCRSRETKLKDANLFYLLRILKYAARDNLYRKGKSIENHLKVLSLNEAINEDGTELGEVLTTSDTSLLLDQDPFREYEEEIRKRLTKKQKEILNLLLQGYKQIEIAKKFEENHQNINYHIRKIRKCIEQVLFGE